MSQAAGLRDLKRLVNQAREQARAAEAERQARLERERLEAEQLERESQLFAKLVGPVQRLQPTGRVQAPPPVAEPLPRQRWADDEQVLRESISDDYEADWLIDADETLSWRRIELDADVVRRLRRGQWTVKGQLDLHGLRSDEAREVLAEFLRESVKREWRCVRVIHGKGLGSRNRIPVLKEKVRRWLRQKDEVLAFVEARPTDGGAGVLIVLLRPPRHPSRRS